MSESSLAFLVALGAFVVILAAIAWAIVSVAHGLPTLPPVLR